MVKARWPLPSNCAGLAAPCARAASSFSASKRAKARSRSGASKSTTSMSMTPSLRVWNWKRPLNFSAVPSSAVSAAASPTARATSAGIAVVGEQHVERGPQPHEAAAHVERRHGERDDHVVLARVRDGAGHGRLCAHQPQAPCAPSAQSITPFCACRRFSASSNTTEFGPSITSSVTSSPRWAGRQCMKIASLAATPMRRALT